VYLQQGTVADVLNAIDLATGVKTASNSGGTATLSTTSGLTASSIATSGALQISTGTTSDLTITGAGNAMSALGLTGNTGTATSFTASRSAGAGSISGKTLTFTSFNSGTAVNVTFGDGTGGTVKTLDQLNTALQANNMTATIDTTGKLTISASNDYASSTLGGTKGGVIGGTVTTVQTFTTAAAPIADATSSSTRAGLVSQFNNILSQITTTAQDASYNGVNLLNGDQLKLVFNEKGTSTLSITGVSFTASGLNLSNLTVGTDFVDNASTNGVLTTLNQASITLRAQASTFGSNLSVVQNRQDFNKNLINVLQTGSSQLTLADTNEEGANLLALQTRQQLSLTSLSLASQADQAVLRLFG
jgi:flagellin-like hook-associated protein FlgL